MTFGILYYTIGMKIGAHKHLSELWAQLFQKNLGTCRLAIKLEETLSTSDHNNALMPLLITALR